MCYCLSDGLFRMCLFSDFVTHSLLWPLQPFHFFVRLIFLLYHLHLSCCLFLCQFLPSEIRCEHSITLQLLRCPIVFISFPEINGACSSLLLSFRFPFFCSPILLSSLSFPFLFLSSQLLSSEISREHSITLQLFRCLVPPFPSSFPLFTHSPLLPSRCLLPLLSYFAFLFCLFIFSQLLSNEINREHSITLQFFCGLVTHDFNLRLCP